MADPGSMIELGSHRRGHGVSLFSVSEMEFRKSLIGALRHLELVATVDRRLIDCIVIERVYEAQDKETGGGYDWRVSFDIGSRQMAKDG